MENSSRARTGERERSLPRYVELIRVSSKGQSDRDTPEDQRRALDKLRKTRPGVLVDRIEDGATGLSGAKGVTERPDLQKLKRFSQQQAFDEIRVFKLDRLTRAEDPRDQFEVWGFAKDANALIVDCQGAEIDATTKMGRIQFFFGTMATAEELSSIAARTHGGRIRAALDGGKYGGHTPYGLAYAPKTKEWTLDPATSPVVQRIFDLCIDGWTLREIADEMNTDGATSPRGKGWVAEGVRSILKNPAYCGAITYKLSKEEAITVKVPALVSEDTWGRAQVARRARKSVSEKPAKLEALLRRRATCGVCGSGMYVDQIKANGRVYLYYRCYSKLRSKRTANAEKCSHQSGHPVAQVDAFVWEIVDNGLSGDGLFKLAQEATKTGSKSSSWKSQVTTCAAGSPCSVSGPASASRMAAASAAAPTGRARRPSR